MPKVSKTEQAIEEMKAKAELKAEEDAKVALNIEKRLSEIDESEGPVRKAISIEKQGSYWSTVVYLIQGDRVVGVEMDEPNLKVIAVDSFKIKAQKEFMDD